MRRMKLRKDIELCSIDSWGGSCGKCIWRYAAEWL